MSTDAGRGKAGHAGEPGAAAVDAARAAPDLSRRAGSSAEAEASGADGHKVLSDGAHDLLLRSKAGSGAAAEPAKAGSKCCGALPDSALDPLRRSEAGSGAAEEPAGAAGIRRGGQRSDAESSRLAGPPRETLKGHRAGPRKAPVGLRELVGLGLDSDTFLAQARGDLASLGIWWSFFTCSIQVHHIHILSTMCVFFTHVNHELITQIVLCMFLA